MCGASAAKLKEELPSEVSLLHEMIVGLEEHNRDLQRQLEWFKRHVFGKRTERLVTDPSQLSLLPQEETLAAEESKQEISAHARKKHPGRREIPEDVPKERIEYLPEVTTCGGCGKELSRIGEEITKELDYQPANLLLREHVRVKLACQCCKSGVMIGVLPRAIPLIEKGRVGPGLLAQIVTSKYCDHLPLHRLEAIFKRQGVTIPRSTQCDWVAQAAGLLEPVYKELLKEAKTSGYVQMDETPVKYQDEANYLHNGYLWAIRSGVSPTVAFEFDESRSKAVPLRLLDKFEGYVQVDDYGGYDELCSDPRRTRVACWAHVRRKFFEAQSSASVRSAEMLALIKQLYTIEREIKEKSPEERKLLRNNRAGPILLTIRSRSEVWQQTELPKSPLAIAIRYTLNQWKELCRYLDDGRIRIDNNAVEQQIRPIAIGRKNYLFFGSVDGGRRAAVLYTVINSCKLAGIDPFAYLRDIFPLVHTESEIAKLTPLGWKASKL